VLAGVERLGGRFAGKYLIECYFSLTKKAGGPSFRGVANALESLLLADEILALASRLVPLDLVVAVGIEIESPKK
jgi:hypothetical protein